MGSELLLRRDFAACACGCGYPPPIAKRTIRSLGVYLGEPRRTIRGHGARIGVRNRWQRYAATRPNPNPQGYCQCGCGQRTTISRKTDSSRQQILGQPYRFLKGHFAKLRQRQRAMVTYSAKNGQDRNANGAGRLPCFQCFEARPALAFLDPGGPCIVCIARMRKVAEVDRRLHVTDVARAKQVHDRAVKAQQASMARGTHKPAPAMTLKQKP